MKIKIPSLLVFGVLLGLISFEAPAMAAASSKTSTVSTSSGDPWKAADNSGDFEFGLMGGLGIVDNHGGFLLTGAAAKKIIPEGFVPGITNPVFIELEMGPNLGLASGVLYYSVHLRWNFQYSAQWVFYALGGLGGDFTGDKLGDNFELFPRFGIGSFYRFNDLISARAELSHETVILGASVALF